MTRRVYNCPNCGTFENLEHMSDAVKEVCKCGSELRINYKETIKHSNQAGFMDIEVNKPGWKKKGRKWKPYRIRGID